MFYSKKISILGEGEGCKDEYGIWHPGQDSIIKTIKADVQPITRELAVKDFGYDEEVEYRIHCDVENIKTGTILEYNLQKYKVVKMLTWEDYMDLLVDSHD